MPKNGLLDPVILDASRIPNVDHLDVWRSSTEPFFLTEPTPNKPWRLPDTSEIYLLDDLMFTHVHFSSCRIRRSHQQLAQTDDDCFILQFNTKGHQSGLLDNGESLSLKPNTFTLQDFAHGYTAISEDTETYGVAIPRAYIQDADYLYRNQPAYQWHKNSLAGQILRSTLFEIWRILPSMAAVDAKPLAKGFLGLLNGLISGANEANRSYLESATVNTMKTYIQQHLTRPDLDSDHLSKQFRVSRATLYRLFTHVGGVQSYIRAQRLKHCYRTFLGATPTPYKGLISETAEQWGFHDAAHFSRLFKSHFLISPKDFVNIKPVDTPTPADHGDNPYASESQRLRCWVERF